MADAIHFAGLRPPQGDQTAQAAAAADGGGAAAEGPNAMLYRVVALVLGAGAAGLIFYDSVRSSQQTPALAAAPAVHQWTVSPPPPGVRLEQQSPRSRGRQRVDPFADEPVRPAAAHKKSYVQVYLSSTPPPTRPAPAKMTGGAKTLPASAKVLPAAATPVTAAAKKPVAVKVAAPKAAKKPAPAKASGLAASAAAAPTTARRTTKAAATVPATPRVKAVPATVQARAAVPRTAGGIYVREAARVRDAANVRTQYAARAIERNVR